MPAAHRPILRNDAERGVNFIRSTFLLDDGGLGLRVGDIITFSERIAALASR